MVSRCENLASTSHQVQSILRKTIKTNEMYDLAKGTKRLAQELRLLSDLLKISSAQATK